MTWKTTGQNPALQTRSGKDYPPYTAVAPVVQLYDSRMDIEREHSATITMWCGRAQIT